MKLLVVSIMLSSLLLLFPKISSAFWQQQHQQHQPSTLSSASALSNMLISTRSTAATSTASSSSNSLGWERTRSRAATTTTTVCHYHSHHRNNNGDVDTDQRSASSAVSSSSISTSTDSTRRRMLVEQAPSAARLLFTVGWLMSSSSSSSPAYAAYIDPVTTPPKITDRVYLDVEWKAAAAAASSTSNRQQLQKKGRINIGLYGEVMPKTVENFVTLCKQNAYAGTSFYRIISDYSIQGGAIGDTSGSGKTGRSSLASGSTFEPDNFNIRHSKRGMLSMVKDKTGGVDSRFFIQVKDDAGWADDRYAAFGIVLDDESLAIVEALEKVPVQPPKNNPKDPVQIVACGIL